jgi:hypothetical protein
MSELPRYRVTADFAYVQATLWRKGSEVESREWPNTLELEPINDLARAVVEYAERFRAQPFFPARPFEHKILNSVYLPATLPKQNGYANFGPPPSWLRVTDAMPLWRTTYEQEGQHFKLKEGSTVVFLGWPQDGYGIEPANTAAEQVAEYYQQHGDNSNLVVPLSSPWCLGRNCLVLAELPAVRKLSRAEAELHEETWSRPRPSPPARLMPKPSGARRPFQ